MARVVQSDGGELIDGFLRGNTTVQGTMADLLLTTSVRLSLPNPTVVTGDSAQPITAAGAWGGSVVRDPITAGRADTLPTGADLDAIAGDATAFLWVYTNTTPATHASTLTGTTGSAIQGTAAVAAATSAVLLSIKLAAATWRTIRLDA